MHRIDQVPILVLDGKGNVEEHVGGYSNWTDRGGRLYNDEENPAADQDSAIESAPVARDEPAAVSARKKLSYKDQLELDALPDLIDELERQQSELERVISAPDFYQQDHTATSEALAQLAELNTRLEAAYEHWEELSG